MTSGSIMRGMISLTMPIMIMNVAQAVFNLLDVAVLKSFGFEREVGAVGACGMLITLCTSLLIGIAAGANVVVARHVGANQKQQAEVAITTALRLYSLARFKSLFSAFVVVVAFLYGFVAYRAPCGVVACVARIVAGHGVHGASFSLSDRVRVPCPCVVARPLRRVLSLSPMSMCECQP